MDSPENQLSKANSDRLKVILATYRNDTMLAKTALLNDKPAVRASALLALKELGQLSDATLSSALKDSSHEVRRRACEIASQFKNVSLTDVLDDSDPYVVEMALWAEGERESADNLAKVLELATRHKESFVRESAIAALGAIGDERAIDVILEAMKDRPNVRRRAVVAMAAFDDEKITQALKSATSDRDWQVRQIAEDLLEITEGSSD